MYKIAVVEDELLESEAICKMIRDHKDGWEVVAVAYSGLEALEKIRQTAPNIVLLDIKLPELNGLEVLRRIKKDDPFIRVIIITAYNEFEFAHQAIKGRVDDFLLKPIRPEQLYEAIDLVGSSIRDNTPFELIEKRNKIIYNIVNRNYRATHEAVRTYIDLLFERCGKNLIVFQNEIKDFLTELRGATLEICAPVSTDPTKLFNNSTEIYRDWYLLYTELMRVVNGIFDITIAQNSFDKASMEDILNYIDRNCRQDISLNQVGEYANMSSYYLSKRFKKETGVNFVSYITEMRVQLAKDMLEYTDIPIINIALELSYHEANYFSKVFKKATGCTPTQYRKLKKNES